MCACMYVVCMGVFPRSEDIGYPPLLLHFPLCLGSRISHWAPSLVFPRGWQSLSPITSSCVYPPPLLGTHMSSGPHVWWLLLSKFWSSCLYGKHSEPVKFLLMKIFKLLWWLSYDAQLFFLTSLFFLNFKTGSESSFLVKRKSNSIGVGEFSRDPVLQRCSPNSQRQSNSLVSYIVFMLSVWSWHSPDNWTPAKLHVIRRSYPIHKCIHMKTY